MSTCEVKFMVIDWEQLCILLYIKPFEFRINIYLVGPFPGRAIEETLEESTRHMGEKITVSVLCCCYL